MPHQTTIEAAKHLSLNFGIDQRVNQCNDQTLEQTNGESMRWLLDSYLKGRRNGVHGQMDENQLRNQQGFGIPHE